GPSGNLLGGPFLLRVVRDDSPRTPSYRCGSSFPAYRPEPAKNEARYTITDELSAVLAGISGSDRAPYRPLPGQDKARYTITDELGAVRGAFGQMGAPVVHCTIYLAVLRARHTVTIPRREAAAT